MGGGDQDQRPVLGRGVAARGVLGGEAQQRPQHVGERHRVRRHALALARQRRVVALQPLAVGRGEDARVRAQRQPSRPAIDDGEARRRHAHLAKSSECRAHFGPRLGKAQQRRQRELDGGVGDRQPADRQVGDPRQPDGLDERGLDVEVRERRRPAQRQAQLDAGRPLRQRHPRAAARQQVRRVIRRRVGVAGQHPDDGVASRDPQRALGVDDALRALDLVGGERHLARDAGRALQRQQHDDEDRGDQRSAGPQQESHRLHSASERAPMVIATGRHDDRTPASRPSAACGRKVDTPLTMGVFPHRDARSPMLKSSPARQVAERRAAPPRPAGALIIDRRFSPFEEPRACPVARPLSPN